MTTELEHLAGETVHQGILPGAEASAHQLAGARGDMLRARKPQLPPGELFAPAPIAEADLFGEMG